MITSLQIMELTSLVNNLQTFQCVFETCVICVSGRRQAIIWTNAGILLVWPLGINSIEILIGIQNFSFKKMHLKMSSAKSRPFCLAAVSMC